MIKDISFWKEGEAFHRTAIGAQKRPEVFTPEIIYNLLAMAIEKYFMAFFEVHNTMPDNHTFTDLIDSANRIVPLPESLSDDLKSLEAFQEICPVFEAYQRQAPQKKDIEKMYAVTDQVVDYCQQ